MVGGGCGRSQPTSNRVPVDMFPMLAWWGKKRSQQKAETCPHGCVSAFQVEESLRTTKMCPRGRVFVVCRRGREGESAYGHVSGFQAEKSLWTPKTHPCRCVFGVCKRGEVGLGVTG